MLENKVIVITGGAGLLGKAFIESILKNKGIAIIVDINEEQGIKLKNTLLKKYSTKNIDFIKMDITSKESINHTIKYLDSKYERIDAVVNNAYPRNKNYGKNFFDVNYDDFIENVGLNVGGYFTTSQQFALYFQKQGHGNIVNISSIYGVIAPKFELYENTSMTVPIEYSAIKASITHMTKYMAKYLKEKNIRVNSISPGGIFNNQEKRFLEKYNLQCLNKGILEEKDIIGTLIFLLSDLSQYINGQNIIIDDGFTL